MYTEQEMQEETTSPRHRQLIKENKDKFRSVVEDMGSFLSQNLSKGFFRNLFTQYDDIQETKFKTSLYDVLSIYIELYQNLEVRINDMLNSK